MSNHDTFDSIGSNAENLSIVDSSDLEQFDPESFTAFFPSDAQSEYEFEDDGSFDYIPPAEGMSLPVFDDISELCSNHSTTMETSEATDSSFYGHFEQDIICDSGIYRSNDGTSEFRSFDDVIPDVTPDGWYHEETPVVSEVISAAQEIETPAVEQPLPSEEKVSDKAEEDEDDEDDEDEHHKHPVLSALGHVFLGFVTFISILYLVGVYSENAVVTKARNMYIQTAMSTLNHKWLATAVIPPDIITDLMRLNYEAETSMVGVQSNWGDVDVQALPRFENATTELTGGHTEAEEEAASPTAEDLDIIIEEDSVLEDLYSSPEEQTFFELFYEIDYTSMHEYVDANPSVVANGWDNININEAGLNDSGTSIKTVYGDQVLAINAQEGVVLIRVNINLSRGVLAICKDTSKLSLCAASTLGSIGQTAGRICQANDGILAITASAFMDDGNGNGGQISGLAICSGRSYGYSLGGGYKRLELRDDNHMYIVDSSSAVTEGTTDACEFTPALIIDGEIVVDENSSWTSPNPRACLGQTAYLETVMVVVEGRLSDSPGCSVVPIAEIMQRYGCVQAMNLDGGTSAIMYYAGEYVTRCSNTALPSGRTLPTAWVYRKNS